MARKPRTKSNTGIYHVVIQGTQHHNIFRDEEDYLQFILTLMRKQQAVNAEDGEEQGFTLYAYSLLPTHIHLLIEEREETIGMVMKRINSSYAHYYNNKYETDGSPFKGRFQSEPVEDDERFLNILRHIHQEPVKAGLASDIDSYPYSSWNEYMMRDITSLLPLPTVCFIREEYRQLPNEQLQQLLEAPVTDGKPCLEEVKTANHKPSDGQVWLLIAQMTGASNKHDSLNLASITRRSILSRLRRHGASVRQLESLTGISRGIIQRL